MMNHFRRLTAIALLACAGFAQGQLGEPEPQSAPALAPIGPLGYWTLDEEAAPKNVADASGNNFQGSCAGGVAAAEPAPGLKFPNPRSLKLDGASGVVTVADAPVLRIGGDFTISFWRKKTAHVKDYARIIGKGNGAQRNFGIWESPDDQGRLLFQMYAQGGGPVIDLWAPGIALNTWTHVLCVVVVNSVAVYYDGKLVANGMRTGEPGLSGDPLTFGHAGYHTFWAGQLDDVRLYNRALSMSEIHYLSSGNGVPAGASALAAAGPTPSGVPLQWAASPTPAPAGTSTYYLVKRSNSPGKDYAVVGSLLTRPTFVDTKVEAGKTYFYVVTAVNTGGESAASNEISVAVPK